MLNRSDNELLTHVGPGTPHGRVAPSLLDTSPTCIGAT
jgi:hypothetical protein